ncbi:MAG TPA: cobalamin-binding protein [Thermodesulfobacteriota bacterium]|nr:cobalamin-binding protein [Thermodesulfobacteriota bacterium]
MRPERIVSLCPSNTEILFALGLDEQIVGVDSHSDYPPKVKELPKVGPDLRINMKKVKALEPDLVVASLTVPGMERNIEALEKTKLPYIILNPHNIEETIENILMLGEITDTLKEAEGLVSKIKGTINSIKLRVENIRYRPQLYWEWWPKPLITACRHSWVNDMSEIVGGINIFSNIEKTSSIVEDSDIVSLNPDILLICWCGEKMQNRMSIDKILTRPGWENIKAIKEKRVYCVPESLFGRPGPRIIDGLESLSQIVHRPIEAHERPEIFGRFDI